MLNILTVTTPSGQTLINVPADLTTLQELGFSQSEAQSLIDGAQLEHDWQRIRRQRDRLIAKTDWTQMPDSPLDETGQADFAAYRQALRDLPQNHTEPSDVVWPTEPTL